MPSPELLQVPKSLQVEAGRSTTTAAWRQRVLLWTLGSIVLILIGLVIYGPWFDVMDIRVSGTEKLDPRSVRQSVERYLAEQRWGILPNRNLWLLSTKHLLRHLETAIRQRLSVDAIDIKKKYRHELRIRIDERLPVAVWRTIYRQGTLDRHGIIIELFDEPPANLQIWVDQNDAQFSIGQRVLEESVVTSITQLQNLLRLANIDVAQVNAPKLVCPEPAVVEQPVNQDTNQGSNTNTLTPSEENSNATVQTVVPNPCNLEVLTKARPEIHVQMVAGPRLLFDRFQPFEPAVSTVQRLLATDPPPTEYIDVRFGDRAYVK